MKRGEMQTHDNRMRIRIARAVMVLAAVVTIALPGCRAADAQSRAQHPIHTWDDYWEVHFQFTQDQEIQKLLFELAAQEPALQKGDEDASNSCRDLMKKLAIGTEVFHINRACTQMLWLLGSRADPPCMYEIYILDFIARSHRFEIPMTDVKRGEDGHNYTTSLMITGFHIDLDRHGALLAVIVGKAIKALSQFHDIDHVVMYCGMLEEILSDLHWGRKVEFPRTQGPNGSDYKERMARTMRWAAEQLRAR